LKIRLPLLKYLPEENGIVSAASVYTYTPSVNIETEGTVYNVVDIPPSVNSHGEQLVDQAQVTFHALAVRVGVGVGNIHSAQLVNGPEAPDR
jgi:hypothetical protein